MRITLLVLLLASLSVAQDPKGAYTFSGKYWEVSFSRSGTPPAVLSNVIAKSPKATDGTGQVAGSIPDMPEVRPMPIGYIVTAKPRPRPASVPLAVWPLRVPLCTVISLRVYLASGDRPTYLQSYNPAGTPVFMPTPSYPRLVQVVCLGASSTDTAVLQ